MNVVRDFNLDHSIRRPPAIPDNAGTLAVMVNAGRPLKFMDTLAPANSPAQSSNCL
jgi:hypothetical protein